MNCLAVRRALQKKQAEKMLNDEVKRMCRKEVDKMIAAENKTIKKDSRYNAMLHVMHLFVILHDEFGFGAKRLGRLWNAFYNQTDQFRQDREDGVAFEKIVKRLNEVGFDFEATGLNMDDCRKTDRTYEKGVRRYDVD